MTEIERILITCFLLSREGLRHDVDGIYELVDAIHEDCLMRIQDSIDYKDELVKLSRDTPLDGVYGDIVRLMTLHADMVEKFKKIRQNKDTLVRFIKDVENRPEGPKQKLADAIILKRMKNFKV